MGACSSKPKTAEFEGSTEPSKENEVAAADRSLEPADAAYIPEPRETGKQKEGAADINSEASEETSKPIANKYEDPLVKGLSCTEEGIPHSVKAETDTIDKKGQSSTAESSNVDEGIVQKVDEGFGASDTTEVSDKATSVDRGACDDDQDKELEDKAVVFNEARTGTGEACFDKGVAAGDQEGAGSGTSTTKDEQAISEPCGAESPVTGVVQPADPVHVEDVSESVGLAILEDPAPVDSMGNKSRIEIERDVSTGTKSGEDGSAEGANRSSELPLGTCEEKREVSHDDPKVSPSVASISDDGAVQEGGADDTRGKELPTSVVAKDVKDTTEPEKVEDLQGDIDERTIESQEENPPRKGEKEICAEVPGNKGSAEVVDECQPKFLKVNEANGGETSIGHSTGEMLEKSVEEQDDRVVEEPVVNDTQSQTLATKKVAEGGKSETFPGEVVAEPSLVADRKEKVENPYIEEIGASEEKVVRVDGGHRELPVEKERNGLGEGDLAYEDVSDVPLKVEASTIEPGDKHSP